MNTKKSESNDYANVPAFGRSRDDSRRDYDSMKPSTKKKLPEPAELQTFSSKKNSVQNDKITSAENADILSSAPLVVASPFRKNDETENLPNNEPQILTKQEKRSLQDEKILQSDNWLVRNGHQLTYLGLFLFSFFVFFRPYELVPQLSFLEAGAFPLALATLLVFLPTQFMTEGSVTVFTTEVKAVLFLAGLALLTMPISKDMATAWKAYNEIFIKAVLMFLIMVNVLRTRRRLMGIIWISLGISVILSYIALGMYLRGDLKGDGYRVQIDFGGMLGNMNDLALHLVTMVPLIICLGIATKSYLMRAVYFSMTILFIVTIMITYSRGGFLGLILACGILVWKIGKKQRAKAIIAGAVIGVLFILLAPGNYGARLLTIFSPSSDTTGSSDQRWESLVLSVIVTLRNPQGIGIGCFPIVGIRNLETHNAYTQVSAEIGWLGLAAYLIFMISPLKKLAAIERTLYDNGDTAWHYYLAIGLQASIAGFMVSSFFGPVAYSWFVYYLIAYAVAFRRIYRIEKDSLK
jgi:putative inorganic carbon (HCO3(-)) transporter